MLKAPSAAILAALAASACSLAPAYQRPPLPIPPAYVTGPEQGGRVATQIGWRDYFGDPRLRAYIAAALANNRDLAVSVARIEEAHALFRVQNAARLPEFDGGAAASRQQTPTSVAESVAGVSAPGPGPASIRSSLYVAQVAVSSYELDFWGRVRNLSEASRRQYLASVEGANSFRLSLIGEVSATYLSIVAGEEGIALGEETLAARQEGLGIAKLRLDAGVTSRVDYDQSALLVTQAQVQLADLRRTTDQSRDQLMVLVGGPVSGDLPAGRSIADQAQFEDIDAGLPSALLADRPDIRQAEQVLRGADANIGAARAAFFPTISLTGSYGDESPDLGNLFKGASTAWSYGASVDLPIFDWGRRQGALDLSKAQRRELVATYQDTVQQAFREVSDALVARRRYREQIAAEEETVAHERSLADTAEVRYQNGVSTYLEVLDASKDLFSAEQSLIQLRALALQNGVSLYLALGGGQDPSPAGHASMQRKNQAADQWANRPRRADS